MRFRVKPGIYFVQALGKKIDTRQKIDQKTCIELYRCPRFSFIEPTKEAIPLLKKEKIPVKELCGMALRAKSPGELEILSQLSDDKTFQNVVATKKKSFKE